MSDKNSFIEFIEDERIVGGIPFPDDLLFHFFNKKTEIADNYLLDPVSNLKLYPKQSGAVKPDALSSGFKLPNSEIDLIGKVEVCLHHKLADVENFGYVWAAQNTNSPYATTGLYLTSGKLAYSFLWLGSTAGACAIWTSALEDDNFYICTQTVGETNISMKMNKVTIVDNTLVIGSDINSTTTAKGTQTLTADIGVLSGRTNSAYVYSSKHKIIWIKFYDKQGALMHEFNFSEGYGSQAFDVVTGNSYDISNVNQDLFWNYTQDFNHYNFRYGFTLYQKAGADDIRIPNKKDGTEIIPVSIPSGYTRIANYKECRQTFNQCESVFKLDDVAVGGAVENKVVTGCNIEEINGTYHIVGQNEGKDYWDNDNGYRIVWSAGAWYFAIAETFTVKYASNAENIWIAESWQIADAGGGLPLPIPSIQTVVTPADDLYSADVDFVLFTEGTGVAKEINIGTLDVNIGVDRGYLYINPNISEHDFMLYGTDKTLKDDVKIIKYIGLGDEIVYTSVTQQDGSVIDEVTYDENDHVVLE